MILDYKIDNCIGSKIQLMSLLLFCKTCKALIKLSEMINGLMLIVFNQVAKVC
jgi:hypothetical protein